ncbi:MAG: aspartate carbamoyltransferase regulatory subunit [Planctomycetes bacterium]|nr:aspartate carbamoyltransferase regulatory subunit [Planctomycetota bacterium]
MKTKRHLVVEAIRNGTVIDHIPADRTLLVIEMLTNDKHCYFAGVNLASTSQGQKGILKIQDKILVERDLQILAALAPDATVNVIEDFSIVQKHKLEMPKEVVGLFKCNNEKCITNNEKIETRFLLSPKVHRCHYCERLFPVQRMKIRRPNS